MVPVLASVTQHELAHYNDMIVTAALTTVEVSHVAIN